MIADCLTGKSRWATYPINARVSNFDGALDVIALQKHVFREFHSLLK